MSRPRLSREQPRPARPRLRWGSPRAALGPCRAGMRARKRYRSAATDSPGTGQRETAAGSRSHAAPPPGCRLLYPAHLLLPWRTFRVSGKLRRLRGTAEPRPPGALPPRRPARPAARGHHVPERRHRRYGRAGRTHRAHRPTDRASRSLGPPAPLTCARWCPGTRGSGPCGGSASASAPTARGSPRRAASEHVRAPGMRAGAAAPPSPAPARAPPPPRLAPRAGPRSSRCPRQQQQHPAEQPVQRAAAGSEGRRTCLLQADGINLER